MKKGYSKKELAIKIPEALYLLGGETRSKIQFMELDAWDLDSIKIMLKRQKLKGINFAVIDTFKAMRGLGNQGMSDWMQFSYTVEQLKKIVGSESRGGLNIGLWLTLQMTDDSLLTKIMGSSSIANSKHVKHSLDLLKFSRMLDSKDKEKYKVKINIPDNPFNGTIQKLDYNKTYYMSFLDKNRSGLDKLNIIYEVNKGKMKWQELGYAVLNKE
jgi:replicative DNA helicase